MRVRVVAALVVLLAIAGCGGGARSHDADPASVVPSNAFIYLEANLDPAGDQQAAVRSVLAALPGVGAPEQRLQEMFDAYAERRYGRHAAKFERDIKPWLGDRMASFAMFPEHGADLEHAPGGLVAATGDEKKARHWVFTTSRQPAERARTYKGVRYLYDSRTGAATGIVRGFVVEADERAFKAVVGSARNRGLVKSPRFGRAASQSPDERLGLVWYDTRQLLTTIARRTGRGYLGRALAAIRRLIPGDPLVLTVRAARKALLLDGEVPANKGGALTSLFDEGSALMDQLPRDALAVVGQPNFGSYLRKLLALSNAAHGGYAGLRRELRRSGLDIESDLLGWMTDAAVFLRKNRDGSLGGALVVQGGAATAVYDGVLRLGNALYKSGVDIRDARVPGSDLAFAIRDSGLRKPVVVAEGGKRMVVAYGRESAEAALSIGGLGGQAGYEAARERLGLDWSPAAYVDVPRLLAVLGRERPGDMEPFLRALRYVIVGGRRSSDRLRSHAEIVVR